MSPFIFRPLFLGCVLLPVSALAQPMSEWQKPVEIESRPITQREFAEAATSQFSFLSELKSWRDTLRGSGVRARREFSGLEVGGAKLGFSLGQVAPPLLGYGAGVAAKWNAFEVGTTAQPAALNQVLARFDEALSGEEQKPLEAPQVTWLRARPLQSKRADVEISLAQGRRDLLAGEGEKWLDGRFQSARARLALPAKWSLSSDFTRAQLDTQKEAASSWGLDASGPISHPWGEARAKANWRAVEDGFATLSNPQGAQGGQSGAVEIAQDVAVGVVSGSVKVAANTRARAEIEKARVGEEIEAQNAQSEAQLRLKLTPNLLVTGQGRVQMQGTQRLVSAAGEGQNGVISPAQARELAQNYAGDVGLQWKFSKALSVAVSTGTSRQRQQKEAGEMWNDGPASDENRRALEVRHQSGTNDFRVRLAQRARRARGGSGQSDAEISQWRIEAARPLLLGVRLKTIVDMARDAQNDQNARRIEAQLQLARAARFDARYREGNLPGGLLADEWSSAFENTNSSSKQWAARLNTGSAASAGAGFGLALEYARGIGTLNNDSWRIGVQFK
ncbi:MAG TPA: hypothetical protein VF627_03535 [Abditibacterium sp.]